MRVSPNIRIPVLVCAGLLLCAAAAVAHPYDSVVVDGLIKVENDTISDWQADDHVLNDLADDGQLLNNNVRDLWTTWNADTLFVGLNYQTNLGAIVVYLDTGSDVGPSDTSVLARYPRPLLLPTGRHADLLLAQTHNGIFDLGTLGAWRATDASGSLTDVTSQTLNAQTYAGDNTWPDKNVLWFRSEIAIPWSVVYPGGMPAHAVLRFAAAVTDTAGAAVYDIMPGTGRYEGVAGPIQIAQMQASIVDFDGDGAPDPLDASAAGSITLEADPGGRAVTLTATLDDWNGPELDWPVSYYVTGGDERTFLIGRLAPGSYTLHAAAPGYFPADTQFTVSAGQAVTGIDVALEKATVISGTLSLALPGYTGGFIFRDSDGTVLASRGLNRDPILPSQYPYAFTFYANVSGTYTLEAWADNHLRTVYDIPVTAGEDVTGLAFTLPRSPLIAGHVVFASGPGESTVVTLGPAFGDSVFATETVTPAAPDFSFYAGQLGRLVLRTRSATYAPQSMSVTAVGGVDQTGLVLTLHRLPQIIGSISFADGPGSPGLLTITSAADSDTVAFTELGGTFAEDGGDLRPFFVEPGTYSVQAEAPGYTPASVALTVSDVRDQTVSVGELALSAVRADRLRLLDAAGEPTESLSATVSIPERDFYPTVELNVEAVDAAGRRDLFDLDDKLHDLPLTARKMDDIAPPGGFHRFLASDSVVDTIQTVDMIDGVARLWMANDAVEVLRVFVGPDVPDPLKRAGEPPTGRFMVGFNPPQPVSVGLVAKRGGAAADSLTADGADALTIEAQLYDSAGNRSEVVDVPVTFSVAGTSSGRGTFDVPTVQTDAHGLAHAQLMATGAGVLQIDATVTVDNIVLAVHAGGPEGPEGTLPIRVFPGPTVAWKLSAGSGLAGLHAPIDVTAQLVDAYGNPAHEADVGLTFSVSPASLGSFATPGAISDADGRAVAAFTPAGRAGIATVAATATAYPADPLQLQLRDVLIATDPPWYAEPAGHQSFDTVDLTSVIVDNTPDALTVQIPFHSEWTGVQLHLILETHWDAAGASSDPFQMPVNYGHAMRPDYALTSKYSSNDYGDFRRADGSTWLFWNTDSQQYEQSPGTNNVQGTWVKIDAENVRMTIPFVALGGAPDSLRCEVYATQEDGGQKRSAFDSVPSDNTLNLTFDYNNPQPGDWEATTNPVTLSQWSGTYRVKRAFPTPPQVADARVQPAGLAAGAAFTLAARVTAAGNGIGDVVADLSAIAGSAMARMYDDGDASHDDAVAGDGVYSLHGAVPDASPGGDQPLIVLAYDSGNSIAARDTATASIETQIDVIRSAEDPRGDDHGPNNPNNAHMYYTYPTNAVFVPGAFDLLSLNVYRTTAIVAGNQVDMLAFEVGMGDFPNPGDPQTANWNPLYADINIQKLDILIDNAPGGATASLPNRQLAVLPWNAWDYAVIIDGWYKALIPSLGLNTIDAWRGNAKRNDVDIILRSDFDRNTITALVSLSDLGDPTDDDIRSWNIGVLMSSHDGGDDSVLGGVRWVNEARSEWNFGGGHYTDRDANIIDLLLSPGAGQVPPDTAVPTQEEALDYNSPQAQARLAQGLTPCAMAISPFKDTGPPVVRIVKDHGEVVRRTPLTEAPLTLTLPISDDYAVDHATFRYRPTNVRTGWTVETAMGPVGNDLWSVDIPSSWFENNLVVSPLDSARYVEFQVEAVEAISPYETVPRDPKVTTSPVTTLQIEPTRDELTVSGPLAAGDVSLRHVEGSALLVPDRLRGRLVDLYRSSTGATVSADSLAKLIDIAWNLRQVPAGIASAPTATTATPLGVAREIGITLADSLTTLPVGGLLPATAALSLHYLQEQLPADADEDRVAIFEYTPRSDRWVLAGGRVNPYGNTVTLNIDHAGVYGLFLAPDLGYDSGEVLSGVTITPNPFSPNGDGLYDRATISFYLTQEASVTVEIYNIDGKLKRRLQETYSYTAGDDNAGRPRRIEGLIWDGTDENGKYVPYGVYVIRLLVSFSVGDGSRTVGSNYSLAVIR